MKLEVNKINKEILIINMIGKFDIEDEQEFQKKLNKLLKEKTKKILFNFSKLNHIDSTGVGSMITIMNLAKSYEVDIYLYALSEHILKIFKSGNLDSFLKTKTLGEMKELFPDIKFK